MDKKKPYEAPQLTELGTVQELTREAGPHKCNGSSDLAYPDTLEPNFSQDCPS